MRLRRSEFEPVTGENMANEISNKGKALVDIDYLPPCFWSTNLFGNDQDVLALYNVVRGAEK